MEDQKPQLGIPVASKVTHFLLLLPLGGQLLELKRLGTVSSPHITTNNASSIDLPMLELVWDRN